MTICKPFDKDVAVQTTANNFSFKNKNMQHHAQFCEVKNVTTIGAMVENLG